MCTLCFAHTKITPHDYLNCNKIIIYNFIIAFDCATFGKTLWTTIITGEMIGKAAFLTMCRSNDWTECRKNTMRMNQEFLVWQKRKRATATATTSARNQYGIKTHTTKKRHGERIRNNSKIRDRKGFGVLWASDYNSVKYNGTTFQQYFKALHRLCVLYVHIWEKIIQQQPF